MSQAMANHAASTLRLRSVAFVPWVVVRLQSVLKEMATHNK